MNVFDYDPIEVGQMSYDEFTAWKNQWTIDFRNISRMIRFQKCQVAEAARYHDLVDNSSYVAAGRCISQRNLQDCKNYARNLMELLEEAKVQRSARRIVNRWTREAEEMENQERHARDFNSAREMYNTIIQNRGVGILLSKLLNQHAQRALNERAS